MSDNDVQSLPPAVASLINLQHLDMSRNGLLSNITTLLSLYYSLDSFPVFSFNELFKRPPIKKLFFLKYGCICI
jgi:Leucine-rich repeat (LRR) protein